MYNISIIPNIPQYPPAEDHPGWIPEVFEDPCHGSKNWLSAGNKKRYSDRKHNCVGCWLPS